MSAHAPLRRHLLLILIVKALVLTALWQQFIQPHRVHVGPASMAQRLAPVPDAAPEKD